MSKLPIKFDMIGIFVQDLTKMVSFYSEVIGLEIAWEGEGSYVEFKHEGIRFSMYERDKLPELLGRKPGFATGLNGTFELSIKVGDKKNVDLFFDRVVQNGGQPVYTPRDEPWHMRSAMIADPEGNLIEIASDFWEPEGNVS